MHRLRRPRFGRQPGRTVRREISRGPIAHSIRSIAKFCYLQSERHRQGRTLTQPSPVSRSRLAARRDPTVLARTTMPALPAAISRGPRGSANAMPTGAAPRSRASSLDRVASHPLCAPLQRPLQLRGARGACPANLFASTQETPCAEARFAQIVILPNTHVPVVVCRSAGIWTRGQLTVLGRPAAGGEPANPAKRGTRLEATTDRAFLVSAGPPKVGAQRGLSFLPGVRTGHFLVQTMALIA